MDRLEHWKNVWDAKRADEVSWFEEAPETSLDLVTSCATSTADSVIDIGGGASRLVDLLLGKGYSDVTVLDIADAALVQARDRLGPQGAHVHWETADVTAWTPSRRWAVWHDRAVFHFLTEDDAVAAYRKTLEAALDPGAWVIIGTFGPEGPRKCSGLWVRRYGPEELTAALGPGFRLDRSFIRVHTTPAEIQQQFHWGVLERV